MLQIYFTFAKENDAFPHLYCDNYKVKLSNFVQFTLGFVSIILNLEATFVNFPLEIKAALSFLPCLLGFFKLKCSFLESVLILAYRDFEAKTFTFYAISRGDRISKFRFQHDFER